MQQTAHQGPSQSVTQVSSQDDVLHDGAVGCCRLLGQSCARSKHCRRRSGSVGVRRHA